MIRDGKPVPRRGSNKRKDLEFLDDLDWLYSELQVMSIGQFCKKYDVPYNCVRHRVVELFPPTWIENIVKERRFHKKAKSQYYK